MSSRNEEILKLKNKIIECEEETLRLLEEKQHWPAKYYLMEQAKERAAAELKRLSEFEKELDDLYKALKREEKIEKDSDSDDALNIIRDIILNSRAKLDNDNRHVMMCSNYMEAISSIKKAWRMASVNAAVFVLLAGIGPEEDARLDILLSIVRKDGRSFVYLLLVVCMYVGFVRS